MPSQEIDRKEQECILVTRDKELMLTATKVGIIAVTPEEIT